MTVVINFPNGEFALGVGELSMVFGVRRRPCHTPARPRSPRHLGPEVGAHPCAPTSPANSAAGGG